MAIQHWNPARDLHRLRDTVNRVFDETLASSIDAGPPDGTWRPALDLFEEPERYVVRADLPGVGAQGVDLRVEEGTLVVSGERRTDGAAGREAYLRSERPSGRFAARIRLPPSVDISKIAATQRDGVLEVVLPKLREAAPPRIAVTVR